MNESIKAVGQAYLSMLAEQNKPAEDLEEMSSKEKMKKGLYNSKMDPVGDADADIDNDGDVDKSDEYLHKRRKAIKKSMKDDDKEEQKEAVMMKNPKKIESPAAKRIRMALASKKAAAKPKDQVSLPKAPWDKKEQKEERVWTVYNRIQEKVAVDMKPADPNHTKGATDPEAIDSKASKGEKDFVAQHGGLNGNDSGIDGDKAAQQTMDAIKNSVKAAPARRNDNTGQEDKMEVPTDTTKG